MIRSLIHEIPISVSSHMWVSRKYHSLKRYDIDNYPVSPDPFKIEWVDPNMITKFTGRPYPHWQNKENMFGKVYEGDWDCFDIDDIPERYTGISISKRFEETVLHKSMVNHFENGVNWEDTKIVKELLKYIEQGQRRWRADSKEELLDRCRYVDNVYESIRNNGFLLQEDLSEAHGRKVSYPSMCSEEIVVDISRNGDLLFVDGRHRLSIAKILDKKVPISFLVRHKNWMEYRETIAAEKENVPDHPDLRDIKSST